MSCSSEIVKHVNETHYGSPKRTPPKPWPPTQRGQRSDLATGQPRWIRNLAQGHLLIIWIHIPKWMRSAFSWLTGRVRFGINIFCHSYAAFSPLSDVLSLKGCFRVQKESSDFGIHQCYRRACCKSPPGIDNAGFWNINGEQSPVLKSCFTFMDKLHITWWAQENFPSLSRYFWVSVGSNMSPLILSSQRTVS